MATRPTFLPNWGTTGPKLKPPSGKAAAGYSPGEEPSAQWDNYREDLQRQWIEYQRDVLDESAVALGGTDANDLPDQLSDLAASITALSGIWTPILRIGGPAAAAVTTSLAGGYYLATGTFGVITGFVSYSSNTSGQIYFTDLPVNLAQTLYGGSAMLIGGNTAWTGTEQNAAWMCVASAGTPDFISLVRQLDGDPDALSNPGNVEAKTIFFHALTGIAEIP